MTLFFLYSDKKYWALFFGVIASLTHNAAVVVCGIFFIVYYVENLKLKKDIVKHSYILMGSSVLSLAYLYVYFLTFTNYETLQDRGSGALFKILDIIIFLVSYICYRFRLKSSLDRLWPYYLGVIVLILFMHITSFLQLRYYAYFDYFRWIGPIYIFSFLLRLVKFKLLLFTVILLSLVGFLWVRVFISDFDFNGLFHNYFIIKF